MRKKSFLMVIFLLSLIVFNFLPLQVQALDVDSHYYLKYYLLRKVGFADEEARIIAKADVSTDKGDTSPGFAYDYCNPKYHAFASKAESDARQTELWNRALQALETGTTLEQKLIPFGQFLHFVEDRLAHEGYGWVLGHFFKGHSVDYLSYHVKKFGYEIVASAVSTWIHMMKDFLGSMGGTPNPITYDDIKKVVDQVINASPYHWYKSPNPSDAKKFVEKDLGLNECSLNLSEYYLFDKDGNKVGYIRPEKFLFFEIERLEYNTTIYNEIEVIENSPFLGSFPEANVSMELLYNFTNQLGYRDPKIGLLGDAISNLVGLSQADPQVMNTTTHLSLLMLDMVFKGTSHVEFLEFAINIRNRTAFDIELSEVYEHTERVGLEIQKMETNPYDADYYYLSGNLAESWQHIVAAEQIALESGVGGIVVPIDKLALLAPYIALASIILVATAIYFKRVKHRKEEQ